MRPSFWGIKSMKAELLYINNKYFFWGKASELIINGLGFFFLLVSWWVKHGLTLTSASSCDPDPSLLAPWLQFHEWAGNNHGWLLPHLSAEIWKPTQLRGETFRDHVGMLEVWSQRSLHICSSYHCVRSRRGQITGRLEHRGRNYGNIFRNVIDCLDAATSWGEKYLKEEQLHAGIISRLHSGAKHHLSHICSVAWRQTAVWFQR